MAARSNTSTWLIYACLIISLSIWGGTSVISKTTIAHFPIFTTLFLRFLIASLCLIPFFIKDSHRTTLKKLTARSLFQLIGLGFIGITLQIGAFFTGIASASVLDASIIIALAPMLICLGGWIFLKERWTPANLLGLSLATFGVILALTTHGSGTYHSLAGNLGILISTLAIVAYALGSKKLAHDFSPLTITTVSFVVGMISFLPLSLWEYAATPDLFSNLDLPVISGLLYLGIMSSVVAYWMYEWALAKTTAHKVGTLTFIQSLVGILLAAFFLNEPIHFSYFLGGLLALIGIRLSINQPGGKAAAAGLPANQALHTKHVHGKH